ncbi:MAG: hypothetical protein ACRD1H_20100, partial [Vicinamibacterales bacterium]
MIGLIALVAVAAAALAIMALHNLRVAPAAATATLRLALNPPDDLTIGGGPDYPFGLSLAPDGRRLVFPAVKAGLTQLWVRDLTTGTTQSLPG